MSSYYWRIRDVPGERLRRLGWWLRNGPTKPGQARSQRSLRVRTGSYLLRITDDRAWTGKRDGRVTRFLRKRLGRREREWMLTERGEGGTDD